MGATDFPDDRGAVVDYWSSLESGVQQPGEVPK
jgi:hypothetical protein